MINRHADLQRAIMLSAVTVVWDGVAGGSAVALVLEGWRGLQELWAE